jgi:glycosyltransferase involved in cell wall biosynthesis
MYSPAVTVCVPTYNKSTLLDKSLRSILAQTFSHFKLIVVDDHSTDSTQEVVRSFNDSRIEYVLNSRNLGLTGNWNRCLELAMKEEAPYIAIYHDDDYYAPTILEREVDFLEKHLRVGLVQTAQFYYKEDEDRYSLRKPYPNDRILSDIELLDDLCKKGLYHVTTPSVMARKDAYLKAGSFDPSFKICPDLDLWWRMLEHYDMGYIAQPLVTQRIHDRQLSSSPQASRNAVTQDELRAVLERALERLCEKYRNLNFEKYMCAVRHYCAKQILLVANDALLKADCALVTDACIHAPRVSASLSIYLGAFLLRLLNNPICRRVTSAAIGIYRYIRKIVSQAQTHNTLGRNKK